MAWTYHFHPDFYPEYKALGVDVRREFIAQLEYVQLEGPSLSRPQADTLKGSRHANMKELRFRVKGGVWRVAFAFDPQRQAILLVAGDKRGQDTRRFYRRFIRIADERYASWLYSLKRKGNAT